jgi:hypothetical protein
MVWATYTTQVVAYTYGGCSTNGTNPVLLNQAVTDANSMLNDVLFY